MSGKRWLNGTTSRNANSTCTPGSATRSSWSSSPRLRSSRSFSVSSRSGLFADESVTPPSSSRARQKARPPDDPGGRSQQSYFDREPDDAFDRLPPERVDPDLALVEPDFARDELAF